MADTEWVFTPGEAKDIRAAVQKDRGITVRQYAELMGYTDRDSAYRVERGEFRPSQQAAEFMKAELDRLHRRVAWENLLKPIRKNVVRRSRQMRSGR